MAADVALYADNFKKSVLGENISNSKKLSLCQFCLHANSLSCKGLDSWLTSINWGFKFSNLPVF